MEAKQLRIGNLVQWDDETQIVPITITRLGNFSVGMESIKPIPLTQEWLEKFGFEKRERVQGRILEFSKGLISFHFQENKIVSVHVGYQRIDDGDVIKNVHSIQNLYFALTGKELTLNT